MAKRSSEELMIGISLAVFIGLAIWMTLSTGSGKEYFPPMSTYSPQEAGTKALYELCEAVGMPGERFHDSEYEYPPGACMVVLDNPDTSISMMLGSSLDVRALRLWLEDGGRLVLFSDQMRLTGSSLFAEIDKSLGLEPYGESLDWDKLLGNDRDETTVDDSPDDPIKGIPTYTTLDCVIGTMEDGWWGDGGREAIWRIFQEGLETTLSDDRPVLWHDIETIEITWPNAVPYVRGDVLLAVRLWDEAWVGDEVWQEADDVEHKPEQQFDESMQLAEVIPLVLRRRVGKGEVIWVPRYEIVCNQWLNRADNHRLVLALIDYAARGEQFYFDEHIHGYHKQQQSIISMLLYTTGGRLLSYLILTVLLLLASQAVRPARYHPEPIPPRRQAIELVLAQAGLYRRAGVWRSVATGLVDGVRRVYTQTMHRTTPPTRLQLEKWLIEAKDSGLPPTTVLLAYCRDDQIIGVQGMVQLARECNAVRKYLECTKNVKD